MKESKKPAKSVKSKGGRPKKSAELHAGSEAAKRFSAGLKFAIAGGSEPKEQR